MLSEKVVEDFGGGTRNNRGLERIGCFGVSFFLRELAVATKNFAELTWLRERETAGPDTAHFLHYAAKLSITAGAKG